VEDISEMGARDPQAPTNILVYYAEKLLDNCLKLESWQYRSAGV